MTRWWYNVPWLSSAPSDRDFVAHEVFGAIPANPQRLPRLQHASHRGTLKSTLREIESQAREKKESQCALKAG